MTIENDITTKRNESTSKCLLSSISKQNMEAKAKLKQVSLKLILVSFIIGMTKE
jgi:hypothetical protein